MFLRQSTASQEIKLGAFLDSTDGNTQETGLTIANTDIKLTKGGATTETNKNSGGGTHVAGGRYSAVLNATDTNTLGNLEIDVHVSGALAVHRTYVVLPAQVYDSIVLGSDLLDVQVAGMDANVLTAAAIAANAFTAAKFSASSLNGKGNWNVGKAGYSLTTQDWNTVVPPSVAQFNARTLTAANYFDFTADTVLANMTEMSGNAAPVNNLVAMYDGTGYVDETAPASRSQVDAIASSTGGALNFEAGSDNTGGAIKGITFVGSQTGTYANTESEDGSYHVIDDTGNAIDIVYQYNVSGNRLGSQIIFKGYLNSNNDTINIQVYDFVGSDWETRFVLTGQNGTANVAQDIPVLLKHTGTGADLGDVLIRFVNTGQSNPQLNIDELLVQGVANTSALGFEGGSVWVDTVSGTSGTADGIGHVNSPSDNMTDARTIADANNLRLFNLLPNSPVTHVASFVNRKMTGEDSLIDMNGQSMLGSFLERGVLTGASLAGSGTTVIINMIVLNATFNNHFTGTDIQFSGTTTFNRAENFSFTTVTFNNDDGVILLTNASARVELRAFHGQVDVQGMVTGNEVEIIGDGYITINAGCTGGTLVVAGDVEVTDNAGGAVTITYALIGDLSAGSGLTAQQTRDAMKLAPSGGAPAVGSVDEHLDNVEEAVITNAAGVDIAADIIALKATADGIPTTAMRGTDGANTTAPDNASITAIKAKTDPLTFTKSNELDANIKSINEVTVNGDGAGTPMGV